MSKYLYRQRAHNGCLVVLLAQSQTVCALCCSSVIEPFSSEGIAGNVEFDLWNSDPLVPSKSPHYIIGVAAAFVIVFVVVLNLRRCSDLDKGQILAALRACRLRAGQVHL